MKKERFSCYKVCILLAFTLLILGSFAFSLLLRTFPSFEHRRTSIMLLFTVNAPLCLWTDVYLAFALFGDKKKSKPGIFRKIFLSPLVLVYLLSFLTAGIGYYVLMGNIDAKIREDKNFQMIAEQLSNVEGYSAEDYSTDDPKEFGYATLAEPLAWDASCSYYPGCYVNVSFQHCRFPFMVKKYVQQLCKDYHRENLSETITMSSELQRLEWNGKWDWSSSYYHAIILWKDCKMLAFRIYGSQEDISNILSSLDFDSYIF